VVFALGGCLLWEGLYQNPFLGGGVGRLGVG